MSEEIHRWTVTHATKNCEQTWEFESLFSMRLTPAELVWCIEGRIEGGGYCILRLPAANTIIEREDL